MEALPFDIILRFIRISCRLEGLPVMCARVSVRVCVCVYIKHSRQSVQPMHWSRLFGTCYIKCDVYEINHPISACVCSLPKHRPKRGGRRGEQSERVYRKRAKKERRNCWWWLLDWKSYVCVSVAQKVKL